MVMKRKMMVGMGFALVCFLSFQSVFPQEGSKADNYGKINALSLYHPGDNGKNPTILKSKKGFIYFLSSDENGFFDIGTGEKEKSAYTSEIFLNFIKKHSYMFTNISQESKFGLKRVLKSIDGDSVVVRLNQEIGGFKVFGGEIVGKLTSDGKLLSLASTIIEDMTEEEISALQSTNSLPINTVKEKVLAFLNEKLASRGDIVKNISIEDEDPYLFSPTLLKMPGATTIVYLMEAETEKGDIYKALADIFTGEVRLWYPIKSGLVDRAIYDANNSYTIPITPARVEGDQPVGIADVDNAYEYLGDAYNFFYTYHDLDSYDGMGSKIQAVVRLPAQNAYYDSKLKILGFGNDFVVDDVVGHEYSHAVIDSLTDLIYFGEPGAIIESYCDIWGEFIDLTNGKGVDTLSVKWLVGEELPSLSTWEGSTVSPIRSLANPPAYNQPDRYNSELFIKLTSYEVEDFGGVHTNSGVGNKLAYLLAEGGSFNGEDIKPFGIERTSKLFFGALELLPSLANYEMLALALNASALTQGFTLEDRFNLSSALRAVEILPAELLQTIKINFRATPLVFDDASAILLTWTPPPPDQYSNAFLLRKTTGYPSNPVDGEKVYEGKGNYYIDYNVSEGVEYYYVLFVEMAELPPIEAHDSAVAGEEPSPVWTQEFRQLYPNKPVAEELQYSQIMFIPTGGPVNPLDGNRYIGSFNKYDAVFIPEVFSFPINKGTSTETVYSFSIGTDGLVSYTLSDAEFPFFGKRYSTIYIGGNGYISFIPVGLESPENFPTLEAHFSVPRISFLFSDLAPDSGGEIWIKRMDDRVVITFDRVLKNNLGGVPNPYSGGNPGSSVQVELFFSGHIRITYLQLDPNYTIVGLSDGRGIPVDPSTITSGIPSLNRYVDFTALPQSSNVLSINPLPVFTSLPDQLLMFDVTTQYTGQPIPYLSAQWLRTDTPPFTDLRTGTGRFSWTPTLADTGNYYLRIIAQQGYQYAYQDIRINVNPVEIKPQAVNLRISSLSPAEDTNATRMVSAGRPLVASYDYIHPLMTTDPAKYAEGLSILYWFRNHEIVPALTNYRTVPANVTRGGDIWYFRVIPITISGIVGEESMSPIIYVVGNPTITQIVPNRGKTTGGESVRIRGKNLAGILSIKFGGVPVVSYKAITEEEIEVITPQHQAGLVDVYIQTVGGFTNLPQAFEFYEEQESTPEQPPEKMTQILWCGGSNTGESGRLFTFADILLLVAVVLIIQTASKKQTIH